MLAVIKHQQELLCAQVACQGFGQRLIGIFADPQRFCNGGRHERTIHKRGKLDPPDAVREYIDQVCCNVDRKTRLAAAACSGERDQARL